MKYDIEILKHSPSYLENEIDEEEPENYDAFDNYDNSIM